MDAALAPGAARSCGRERYHYDGRCCRRAARRRGRGAGGGVFGTYSLDSFSIFGLHCVARPSAGLPLRAAVSRPHRILALLQLLPTVPQREQGRGRGQRWAAGWWLGRLWGQAGTRCCAGGRAGGQRGSCSWRLLRGFKQARSSLHTMDGSLHTEVSRAGLRHPAAIFAHLLRSLATSHHTAGGRTQDSLFANPGASHDDVWSLRWVQSTGNQPHEIGSRRVRPHACSCLPLGAALLAALALVLALATAQMDPPLLGSSCATVSPTGSSSKECW